MLLPKCFLLSTLIYKKEACLSDTYLSVLSDFKSKSNVLSNKVIGKGGGRAGALRL